MGACSKKTDEPVMKNKPEDAVSGFFAALEARDSIRALQFLSSEALSTLYPAGDSTAKKNLLMPTNYHVSIKVIRATNDSLTPNLSKVYVSEIIAKDTEKKTFDSLYYYVAKESDTWKLVSLRPGKD
jgi:hypothetical protein